MNNKKLVVLGTVGVVASLLVVYGIRLKNKMDFEEYCMLIDFLNQIKEDIFSHTQGEQFESFMNELEELYHVHIRNRKELEGAFNRAHNLHDRVMACI